MTETRNMGKRKVHLTKPLTASEIRRRLRITKADMRAALRAIEEIR
jgi:DNA-binding transcriptional regulator GbsR (MarR family)